MDSFGNSMISVVVLTKNEEKNIKECLESLQWADEIIIVDDYSQDKTRKIAQKFGAKVFKHRLGDNFANQRNFGLKKARGDWVLFVDADERVPPLLAKEIRIATVKKHFSGFYLKRKDYFLGRWLNHGETAHLKFLRLAKKNSGRWQRGVHEFWQIEKGRIGELKEPLLHYSHSNLTEFLEDINYFSTLDAQIFYQEKKKLAFLDWLKPLLKFIQNYFLRLGFLDGFPGLIMALMMSLYSLTVRIKVWEVLLPASSSASIKISFSPSERIMG